MSNFNYLSRQNHVSLVSQPHTIQNFVKSFADRVNSYHDHDRSTAQGNQFAPQFNVTETKSSYVLDGEVPGVGDQSSIHVVWLQNHVLLINGVISCPPTGEASEGVQEGQENEWTSSKEDNDAPKAPTGSDKTVDAFPRHLLRERHFGPFQRSFTFPGNVAETDIKASLKDGVLRVVVPKEAREAAHERQIDIEIMSE